MIFIRRLLVVCSYKNVIKIICSTVVRTYTNLVFPMIWRGKQKTGKMELKMNNKHVLLGGRLFSYHGIHIFSKLSYEEGGFICQK